MLRLAAQDHCGIFLSTFSGVKQMKIFSNKPFKSLAVMGTLAVIVSTAFAASYDVCQPACTGYAQTAYTQSKAYYATQQTNYCNSLPDPNARSACLASVPAYSEQQAQSVYTSVMNQCMQSCLHS
jgi:hypothetical protein